MYCVKQQCLWWSCQLGYCIAHSIFRSLQNIALIDHFDRANTNANRQRMLHNNLEKPFPFLCSQLLRITHSSKAFQALIGVKAKWGSKGGSPLAGCGVSPPIPFSLRWGAEG